MRTFFLRYQNNKKLATLVQDISWSKNIIIMENVMITWKKQVL
ncbi:MAG: DUF1016 domain-containing protein [bacterium]|nr:DUF1016 domain-containing protein [bacterium]